MTQTGYINFEEYLYLEDYVHEPTSKSSEYSLMSVIVKEIEHIGDARKDHYTMYCETFADEYHKFNHNMSSKVNISIVQQNNPYMLIYQETEQVNSNYLSHL